MIIQASIWSVFCGWNRRVPAAGEIICPIEAKKGPDDPDPVPPEVDDHGGGRGDVQPDDECQVR